MTRVYFILGCTASGKGAVGRLLARRIGGQIISIDSMRVYRRMDISTGKPGSDVRAEVPHHCIDIVEPRVKGTEPILFGTQFASRDLR